MSATISLAEDPHEWQPIETYKKDGRLVLLLITGGDHRTEDAETFRTIGFNSFEQNDDDEWHYAGWCWSHDHWTQAAEGRRGTPIKWCPMPALPEEVK